MREVVIADRKLGDGHPPFIVGEVGINHNGNLGAAMQMICAAKEAGCDAVKFATFKADEFCQPSDPLYPAFKAAELPDDAWALIKIACDKIGITFFSTPQNESDLNLLLKAGVPCIKIGSDDLTNLALLEAYAKHGLPMILSTGMADMRDVNLAWEATKGVPVVICACTSEYPCPPEHANLGRISQLRLIYDEVTGFSDHTIGAHAAIAAAALGASYFEKHFTLDNSLPGPDHKFSANPKQLKEWADAIREAHVMLGNGVIKPTEQERINRVNWRRTSGQQLRGAA